MPWLPLRYRPLTLAGLAAGLVVTGLARALGDSWLHSAMFGWCAAVLVHATLLMLRMWPADAARMRAHAKALDEGRVAALLLSLLAAGAALVAVGLDLADQTPGYTALGVATVALSWTYVHLLFAQDYAREYWLSGGGIHFPGGSDDPPFSEFLYLAFSVGATNGVTDMVTHSVKIRRVALLHQLIAFAFNAVIVAGTVGIVTGLAGGGK
ncbi:DUF1345 domain-containing protein [Roseomonas haemaphysalidis]|uniref:DUF1345 domain-containing protein n=1 Tax=Roseomonas haemaphysalidis TaxID=2768162 RepID=A0ABS3KJ17_9PROT|nr:DUF1345 domain-containing protein [Roseomonas haemaphysalidis]MBO1077470.1 DUF1345 domain-containing protein [Roseomonas haemaphysalidis]